MFLLILCSDGIYNGTYLAGSSSVDNDGIIIVQHGGCYRGGCARTKRSRSAVDIPCSVLYHLQ